MRRNAQSGNSFNNKDKTTTNSSSSKQELFVTTTTTTTTKDVTSRLAAAPMVVVVFVVVTKSSCLLLLLLVVVFSLLLNEFPLCAFLRILARILTTASAQAFERLVVVVLGVVVVFGALFSCILFSKCGIAV
jgi:hypothetical protein